MICFILTCEVNRCVVTTFTLLLCDLFILTCEVNRSVVTTFTFLLCDLFMLTCETSDCAAMDLYYVV